MSQDMFIEDKKCRLCGRADSENEHIFEARDRNLLKKIAAVYSIWITFHDPLPKCICQKCYAKVVSSYKNICQVKKLQTKWIENVQSIEPSNNYIEVLSFIERANVAMKNFIQTNYGERLQKDAIENLLISSLSGWKAPPSTQEENKNDTFIFSASSSGTNTDNENETINTEKHDNNEDEDMKPPLAKKPKLSQTPTIVKCKYCVLKFESLEDLAAHQVIHLKLSVPKLFQPKVLNKNFRRGRLISVQSRQSIRCLNCYLVFDDNKCILEHWSKAECDFFCQICGEEFAQSPKLLRDHITEAHGISYRSLKMQRDLAYLNTSPKQQILSKPKQKVEIPRANNMNIKPKVINTNLFLNQPPNANGIEVTSSTTATNTIAHHVQTQVIKCRICNRDFRNFKACNSHMRAHKPPYAYNDTELLPDMNTDAYMEPEPMIYGQTTITPPKMSNFTKNVLQINTPTTTSSITAASSSTFNNKNCNTNINENVPKKIEVIVKQENPQINSNHNNVDSNIETTPNNSALAELHTTTIKPSTSTAPRGIRMKFVSRRSDLNVNGANNASIKVKSLNDLQNIKTNQMLQNLQHSQIIKQPTHPTQQHDTVIVNNFQQQQEQQQQHSPTQIASSSRRDPPLDQSIVRPSVYNPTDGCNQDPRLLQQQQQQTTLPKVETNSFQMPSFIKDEPMEFI